MSIDDQFRLAGSFSIYCY